VAAVYFKIQNSLYARPCLVLPQNKNGRIQHFTQVTNVAPEFAPSGWHLISASVLNFSDVSEVQLVDEVKKEIAGIFPKATKDLTHLATIHVPYAVPDQPPGFASRNRFEKLPKGVYASGDWCNGASIQAALTSGQQTARKLLKDLSQ
jgi:predicted NAD/FAD-dependent oxidoreductase